MNKSNLIAILFILTVLYYVTGAGSLFRLFGNSSRPDTSSFTPPPAPPAAAVVEPVGDPQQNPFVVAD